PFTPKIFDPGQLLRASSSQEAHRSPIVATVNFRAGVQQFDRPGRGPHWAEPPLVQAEAHATLCATGARSSYSHQACAQFRFAVSLASPIHLPAPASSRFPPLNAFSF